MEAKASLKLGPAQGPLDFVTVVYGQEVLLLKLQARSFRLFVRDRDIGSIVIIINEENPTRTIAQIEENVLPEYGQFLSRVKLVRGDQLVKAGITANGWRKQQTMKLLISRRIANACYVVLDAKNHFIAPASVDNFLTPDRRMRTFRARQRGSLMPFFVNAMEYFGLDPEQYLDRAMPATTPYALSTVCVRGMLDEIEERERVTFADFFHAPRRHLTEFFLYFAFLEARCSPIENLYAFGRRNTLTLFTKYPDTEDQLKEALAKLKQREIIMFGLHKNRILSLDRHSARAISNHWAKVGLFPDKSASAIYMKTLRQTIKSEMNAAEKREPKQETQVLL